MFNPVSTYRLQFNKSFTLKDLEAIIPYLSELGIRTIYASPLFKAVPGSMHGYDSTDPNEINPEIGTLAEWKAISKKLKERGIEWLQDIVPNHMAYHHDNKWLMDVLEKGEQSEYAPFFDINWSADPSKQLLAPFLNEPLEKAIEAGDLKISFRNGKCWFTLGNQFFPLNDESYKRIRNIDRNLEEAIVLANTDPFLLRQLAGKQFYRLCPWKTTDKQINYRRFFTVNGLICLCMQKGRLFNKFHQTIFQLIKEFCISGIRVDHIDGLMDPAGYLSELRSKSGNDLYICIEKILQPDELLPVNWPIQGTTGYDFLGMVNNLFGNKKNKEKFISFYQQLINDFRPLEELIDEKKGKILYGQMAGELNNLYTLFKTLNLMDHLKIPSASPSAIKEVIAAFLIECPVYRYYSVQFPLNKTEALSLSKIINRIKHKKKALSNAATVLEHIFLEPSDDENHYQHVSEFYKRCMQFTGPLMAKGIEDTLMYSWNCMIAHNDVGSDPGTFGISTEAFHRSMQIRREQWPLTLNTTSTHDTKRGEDVRARLNVLTDVADEWFTCVEEWQRLNADYKKNNMPDKNDEYFLYQLLIGTFPMPFEKDTDFHERINLYIPKALREAKIHSNWSAPNEEYEKATLAFFSGLLEKQTPFWKSFKQFHYKIADDGIINSLSQLVLKYMCPGTPDLYQGTELWDLSLVDPDNRRPIDFVHRNNCLDEFKKIMDRKLLANALWEKRQDGKIKLYCINRLLEERRLYSTVFEKGAYIPMRIEGIFEEYALAFIRQFEQILYLIVVPLHTALMRREKTGRIEWKSTQIILLQGSYITWENIFTGTKIKTGETIQLKDILKELPFTVLRAQRPKNTRGAGILLPVSALPSAFGIGDLGPEAKNFIDFLNRSCQKYWQILPLNPIDSANAYSPYSSISSMAGNTLFISPELLVSYELLYQHEIESCRSLAAGTVNYTEAERIKEDLLKKAFQYFLNGNFNQLKLEFETFKKEHAFWLSDYTAFCILKHECNNAPWYEWPEIYRNRQENALIELEHSKGDAFQYIQWKQYLFHKQWRALKSHANHLGISIIGDLPFYVSYDSADVWANKEIFSLEENNRMNYTAGVPPDYFSKDGQLWGMPTFRWDVLKKNNYKWWIDRIKKNLELMDLLRIDHFRAFAEYWEVPANESTAINGKWKKGPGEHFFQALKNELGSLPFVAEDLGDRMEMVYRLREKVDLPGMKVLQFAFGENMSQTVDIPHNFNSNCIVYTGTHDNNTTVGWYKKEMAAEDKQRLNAYSNTNVTEKNVHDILSRMAYASIAKTAILPFQDILGLDESARINTPGTNNGNWLWQVKAEQLDNAAEKKLRDWTYFYNRQ
jgi:malto-oligosyltrehalose synthase/4-alpha-glucanotransferase